MSAPTAWDVLVATIVGVLLGGLLSMWVATLTSRRSEASALANEQRLLEREHLRLASKVSVWVDLDDEPRYFVLNRTDAAIHGLSVDFTLLSGRTVDTMEIVGSSTFAIGLVPPVGDATTGGLPGSWARPEGMSRDDWFCLTEASFHDTSGDEWRIGEDGLVTRGVTRGEIEQIALDAVEESLQEEERG
jgi:hypothetical protein